MNIENGETVYECVVALDHYSLNDHNYWVNQRTENVTVDADDREYLYRRLGELKALETAPEDNRHNYTSVSFGSIRQVVILSEDMVDEQRVLATPAMHQYQLQREAKIRANEAARIAREAAKTARELAELDRLSEKYRA